MAITRSTLTTGATLSVTSADTATVAPTAGRLQVLFGLGERPADNWDYLQVDDGGCGLSWSTINAESVYEVNYPGDIPGYSADMYVWAAVAPGGVASGHATLSGSEGYTWPRFAWIWLEFDGVDPVDPVGTDTSAGAHTAAASPTSCPFSTSFSDPTNNVTVAACGMYGAAPTAPAGYATAATKSSGSFYMAITHKTGEDTNPGFTYSSTRRWGTVAFEVIPGPPPWVRPKILLPRGAVNRAAWR